jgi:hypothetical protein
MNIIKFKDEIYPGDDLFNTYLKGKYAYWIQMRYVVPFDFITTAQYVQYESDAASMTDWQARGLKQPDPRFWDLNGKQASYEAWVDVEGTETANSISTFVRKNNYTTDSDITIEEIKKFRSWLADALLDFDRDTAGEQKRSFFSDEVTDMLLYYKNNLYNSIVKTLSNITPDYSSVVSSTSTCGCSGNTDLSNLYSNNLVNCDALYIYRKYVYKLMCDTFGQIDFWTDFSTEFIYEFKKYIDNIITLNLPLTESQYQSVFTDCSCSFNLQATQIEILNRLSKSLALIAENEVTGNKNFISKALRDWSQNLYEGMYWK